MSKRGAACKPKAQKKEKPNPDSPGMFTYVIGGRATKDVRAQYKLDKKNAVNEMGAKFSKMAEIGNALRKVDATHHMANNHDVKPVRYDLEGTVNGRTVRIEQEHIRDWEKLLAGEFGRYKFYIQALKRAC